MKKRFLACIAVFMAMTVNVQAVDYSIKNATGGVIISGNTESIGDSVNVTVYDRNNNLLYIDQEKTSGTTAFEFRAAVDTQTGLKVKVGGRDYSPTMQYTEDEESADICYVGYNTSANQDGTIENPYSSIATAFAQVENGGKIFALDEIAWDDSISGNKTVTIMGTGIKFSASTTISPNVTLENVKIAAPSGCNVTANNLTVGSNVVFSNPVNITAQKVDVKDHIDGLSITNSTLVCINKDASVSTGICSNCDYVLKVTNGGTAKIENNAVVLTPEDERVVSVNGGAFTLNTTISQVGVYDVVFDYDFKLHSIDISKNLSEYAAKVELSAYNRNSDSNKTEPVLIYAVYDSENKIDVIDKRDLTAGSQDSVSVSLGNIKNENFTAKFFIWDSFGHMCPLCEVAVSGYSEKDSYTYFVSPNGNDSNEGTLAKPFKTITAALNAAKGKTLPTTIYLRGGTYNINQQIEFNATCNNITFKPYENEKPIITTGYEISGSSFAKVSDGVVSSIADSTARANVVAVSLTDLGITDISAICDYRDNSVATVAPVLMQDDKRMELAKYPDTGYLTISSPSGGDGTNAMQFKVSGGFTRAANWSGSNVYADGYIAQDWKDSRAKVNFTNTSSNCIITAADSTLKIVPQSGKRVRFINIPQEISMKGEWYLDYNTKKLYMYPYDNFSSDSVITLNTNRSNIESLFDLDGCSNISFEGIEFKHIGTEVMNVEDVEGFTVKNCHFIDTIGDCIVSKDSNNMLIKDNKFEYLSGGAVTLHGGDSMKLIKSNNFVTNNEFHDFSLDRRTYNPAITINGCGNTVNHNEIYNSPHMAIGIHGISFTIEYNDIYNVCNDTADSGALYSGQRVHLVNNKINNNYFHDINNKIGDGYSVNAIYFDDLWSSAEVSSNIFYDVDRGCLVGGGRSNSINNNIFISSNDSIKIDDRGNSINFATHPAYTNLFYSPAGDNNKSEIWLKEYPEVCNILSDSPATAKYNSVYNNICISTLAPTIAQTARSYANRIENNISPSASSISGAFYDYSNQKYEIVNQSVIKSILSDFIIFDFDAIGLIR
jgi:hypothetical protein